MSEQKPGNYFGIGWRRQSEKPLTARELEQVNSLASELLDFAMSESVVTAARLEEIRNAGISPRIVNAAIRRIQDYIQNQNEG